MTSISHNMLLVLDPFWVGKMKECKMISCAIGSVGVGAAVTVGDRATPQLGIVGSPVLFYSVLLFSSLPT